MFQKMQNRLRKLNTQQMTAVGFAGLILAGAILLWMPFCRVPGETTSFTDAFFTAATSVCVTGLVTVNTAAHWSAPGKLIILALIQSGGIGVVAMASMVFISLHRNISMRNRKVIQESYHLETAEGMTALVKKIILCVFCAEAAGAVCYALCFIPRLGLREGTAQAVFLSVSAFCNAGIDILGEDSLAPYRGSLPVNLITIALVVLSGLGFTCWWDIGSRLRQVFQKKLSPGRIFRTLHLHSQMVLLTTAVLVLSGTVLIFLFECRNPRTLLDMPVGEKWMAALFQSVTTRTAGFFTIPQEKLSGATVILCLFLMFVGGSPMGTAGGIKTTTLAVLALSVSSNLRGRADMEFRNRKIRENYIRSAVVVAEVGIAALAAVSILLALLMPREDLTDLIFETVSAVGTVGLSRGLTARLVPAAKWVVAAAMYLGRVGPITLGTAVLTRVQRRSGASHLAEEDIMIG